MTISTDRTTETTVDQFVIDAYISIGTWNAAWTSAFPQYTAKIAFGKRKLQRIMDGIPAEDMPVVNTYMYDLTLTADDYTYNLPAGTIKAVGDGAYMAASETDLTKASAEYMVQEISREHWQGMGSKDTTGRPTYYWQDRSGTLVELNLWPIPDEAGTIRFQLQRRLASVLEGDATMEMPTTWNQYLQYRLMYELGPSEGMKPDVYGPWRSESERLKKEAQSSTHQQVPTQARLGYQSRWR